MSRNSNPARHPSMPTMAAAANTATWTPGARSTTASVQSERAYIDFPARGNEAKKRASSEFATYLLEAALAERTRRGAPADVNTLTIRRPHTRA